MIELKGNIRVLCRCRPLNQNEITNGSTSIVDFDSSQDNELQVICSDSSKKQFKFDHVFRPEDNQGTLELVTLSVLLIIYWKDQLIDFNCFNFLILSFYKTQKLFSLKLSLL